MKEPTPNRILARYLRVYPDFGEHVQTFVQQKHAGKMSWPAWCFLPLSGAAAIVQAEAARLPGGRANDLWHVAGEKARRI